MVWKQPQLTDPPMGPTDEIRKAQHRLLYAFPVASNAVALGVRESGIFDLATDRALRTFQAAPAVNLPATGVLTYDTKVRLGVIVKQPAAPSKRFRQQGVAYPAMGFGQPDPNVSYNESRDVGTGELLRLSLGDLGPKVWMGYSQGADVVVRALLAWPVERRNEIVRVVTFGSPGRPPGVTLLGNDPGGWGISGVFTPEWAWSRTYDFAIAGDMYAGAVGLLPALYDVLTRLEASLEFAAYLFGLLTSTLGGPLLGLVSSVVPGAGALSPILGLVTAGPKTTTTGPVLDPLSLMFRLPEIIETIVAALKFVSTQAHFHYHDQPLFSGMTGVDRAARIIRDEVSTATVYTVPGTWAGWNDGPPAWVAWKLP